MKFLKKKDDFNIFTYNFGVGEEETTKDFNTVVDSQSSTFAEIANDSKYFLIKKKILQPFSKKEYSYKQSVKIRKLSNFIEGEKLDNIDVLKTILIKMDQNKDNQLIIQSFLKKSKKVKLLQY